MTTTLPLPSADDRTSPVWVEVADDLWSFSADGRFFGVVERIGPDVFRAMDGRGHDLGGFDSFDAARQAIVRSAA